MHAKSLNISTHHLLFFPYPSKLDSGIHVHSISEQFATLRKFRSPVVLEAVEGTWPVCLGGGDMIFLRHLTGLLHWQGEGHGPSARVVDRLDVTASVRHPILGVVVHHEVVIVRGRQTSRGRHWLIQDSLLHASVVGRSSGLRRCRVSVEAWSGHPQADTGFLAGGDRDGTVGGEIEGVWAGEDGEGCGRGLLSVVGRVRVLEALKGVFTSPFSPPHAACNTTQHATLRCVLSQGENASVHKILGTRVKVLGKQISRLLLWISEAVVHHFSGVTF